MRHFSEMILWLRSLLRSENHAAVIGSIKRRLQGYPFLTMSCCTIDFASKQTDIDIKLPAGYHSGCFENKYKENIVSLLNSIGSLDYWNPLRFKNELLSTTPQPEKDIFCIYCGNTVVAMAVLQTVGGNRSQVPEIGYVAVSPKHRKLALARPLLQRVIREAHARNYQKLVLKTDAFRLPAIKRYFEVGFLPVCSSESEKRRWQYLAKKLQLDANLLRAMNIDN